jgi:ribonuclease BN (tRNA processing enzyme)
MRLTVVGWSGSYPGPESPCSCYLVEAEHEGRTWRILLDLGSGALGALHRYVDPLTIDAVLLSHLHPDHCFDISGYYVMRKYHPDVRAPRIPVYGPKGTGKRMAKAYGLPEKPGMNEEFDFRGYDAAGPVRVGPFSVVVTQVDHPVTAYALRISDGDTTLVYTGDTGPCDALTSLAKGADLLLAEASFLTDGENPPNLHLTGRDAAETAAAAGVGMLVLTHIPPWHDPQQVFAEARPAYDGRLELARTGAVFDL